MGSRARVLVVDDDRSFSAMVAEFLAERYDTGIAGGGAEALDLMMAAPFDLVLSDVNMPGMSGPELLVEVARRWPGTRTMLITSYNVDDYIAIARAYSFSTIMSKTVPFNFPELETMVDGILTGEVFGLRKYLLAPSEMVATFRIRSSQEAREVREKVVEVFTGRVGTAGDMKLLIDETVTNAIYHAPHFPDGRQKYEELTEVTLAPDEQVLIECGIDREKYGIAVVDNQGKLRKETVLDRIARQVGGEGILDDSGRGIHMSRLFSDMMVINIRRDVKTEVILINYISSKPRGFKPLYINEL